MTPPQRPPNWAATLIPLDAGLLRELPMETAPRDWPTAEQVAARLDVAVDVARSALRRLNGRRLAEHDGGRPRRWARTAWAEQALEWEP